LAKGEFDCLTQKDAPRDERSQPIESGLLTRTATMESVSLCVPMKS
jgi:hypothetical protein